MNHVCISNRMAKGCGFAVAVVLVMVAPPVLADDHKIESFVAAADRALALPDNRLDAVEKSRQLSELGKASGDATTQARGLIRMGWAGLHFGDWGDHVGQWRFAAEQLIEPLPSTNVARAEVMMFEGYLSAMYFHRQAEGTRQINKAITIGRTLEDDRLLAKAFYLLGRVLPYDGQNELGFNCLNRSAHFAKRAGMPAWEYKALLEGVQFGSTEVRDEQRAARRAHLREELKLSVTLADLPFHERLSLAREQMKAVDYPHDQGIPSKLEDVLAGQKASQFLVDHYLHEQNWDEWNRALLAAEHAAMHLQDSVNFFECWIERAAGLARQGKTDQAIEFAERYVKEKEKVGNYFALRSGCGRFAKQLGLGGDSDHAYEWFLKASEYQQKAIDRRLIRNRRNAGVYVAEEIKSRELLFELSERDEALVRSRATLTLLAIGTVLLGLLIWLWQRGRQHKLAEVRLQQQVDEQTESLRVAKELAERANRAKTDFLARVNHELRNPLTAIVSSCEILGDCLHEDPVASKCGETITACTQGLVDVIDEILDFTQIESGQLAIRPSEFSPTQLINTVGAIVETKLPEDVELQLLIDPKSPDLVRTDQAKLRQVLLNLALNSVRHTDTGFVRIEVRSSRVGGSDLFPRLTFVVSDSGCGMSAAEQATIFRQYQTYSERSKTGLGLYISQAFVRCLGGRIDCDSQTGVGTTFTIEVPFSAVETDVTRATPAQVMLPKGATHNFLIVDDEVANRETVAMLLSRGGHSASTGATWESAKQILHAGSVDVVLLDLQMPGMTGYEVIRAIRKENLAIQPAVFAMTGDATQATRDKTLAAGFTGFLPKPFRVADLERLLDKHLSHRRAA